MRSSAQAPGGRDREGGCAGRETEQRCRHRSGRDQPAQLLSVPRERVERHAAEQAKRPGQDEGRDGRRQRSEPGLPRRPAGGRRCGPCSRRRTRSSGPVPRSSAAKRPRRGANASRACPPARPRPVPPQSWSNPATGRVKGFPFRGARANCRRGRAGRCVRGSKLLFSGFARTGTRPAPEEPIWLRAMARRPAARFILKRFRPVSTGPLRGDP